MALQLALAFSLGVHLLVFLSLGLVGDGNPRVRAYRWFVGAVMLWLVLALLGAAQVAPEVTGPFAGAIAHFLPIILFAGGALPAQEKAPPLRRWAVAASVLLLPFTISASPWHHGLIELLYYAGAWGLAGFAVYRAMQRSVSAAVRLRWAFTTALLVVGVALIGVLVATGAMTAIALLAALLQAVVLYATVRLSLYAVREDASRTGALAADVAEQARRAVAGEITAMVAHEIRNPLTGVRSLAQRLADDDAPEERRRRYADLIVREVDRVERMISALLHASSRRGAGSAGETDLPRLFDDVALLVSDRYRRAGVRLSLEPAAMQLAVPPEPLAQVLLNFLLNAVQQAPAVRHVRLRAAVVSSRGVHAVELHVQDDGPGVPSAEREAIFAPFHSGTDGSGLGLAVVRRLCDEWGWSVAVRDTPGGGATFVLALPPLATSSTPRASQPFVIGDRVASGREPR